jgi:predicted RNA polymerase sigma factor
MPYWAVRAHLLAKLGKLRDAEMAYTRAIGLSEDAKVRAFLMRQSQRITDGSTSTI